MSAGSATVVLLRLGLLLARGVPLAWCRSLGAAGGRIAGRVSSKRRVVGDNLHAVRAWALGGQGERSQRDGSVDPALSLPHPVPGDVFASYGRYWGEFLALAARPARLDRLPLRIEGEAFLTTAAARGPVCCLTGHLGNWDLAARLIARRLPGFAVMAEELEPRALFHAFTAIREEAGCRVIAADRGGLRLYRHLREGGHAGLVIDRVIGTGTRRAAFAGGMREFPAAGLDLARRAGAALVPVFLVRERGEFLLRIHPPLPESGDPVDAFARILESEVAAFAAQWCLLYPLHASMDDAEFPRGGAVEGKVVTA